jgi:hypothetical protein
MADRELITQPTLGSNEVGTEINDRNSGTRVSAATDTQLHLAAKSGNGNKHTKNNNYAEGCKEIKK